MKYRQDELVSSDQRKLGSRRNHIIRRNKKELNKKTRGAKEFGKGQ